jgi:glycosyltransferase involved in cell wall biosynthesis
LSKISVIIITFNEDKNIEECLSSVSWADEIIVVDSGSKDNTLSIVKQFTDNIIITENIPYGLKRNLGIDNASSEWIFWLDADERVSEELTNEIKSATEINDSDSFYIKRKSFFINRFIKHCGWYPDYSPRLFRKSSGAKFDASEVHEKLIYSGKSGKLKNEILHYTDLDFEHYTEKMNSYTTLSAKELQKSGRKSGILDIVFRPVFAFCKMYFFKLGFLDGYTGLILCILSSYHVFFKYAKHSTLIK